MITMEQFDELMEASKVQGAYSDFRKGAKRMNFIKKFKLDANSSQTILVPLVLGLPFDPTNLDNDVYSKHNPFFFNSTVETAWEMLHMMCEKNPALENKLSKYLGVELTPEVWAYQGNQLAVLLKKYRYVNRKGDYTIAVNLPALSKYEVTYQIPSELDENGIPHYTGLLYQLSCLEQELIKPQLRDLEDKFKEGGEFAHYSKKQKTAERQKVRSMACISTPRYYGVTRVIYIPTENDEPTSEILATAKSSKYEALEQWMKMSQQRIDSVMAKIGGKQDIHPSFVEYSIQAGDDDPMQRYANANKSVVSAGDSIISRFEDFDKKYTEYRNDTELQSDKTLALSIRDLRQIDDNTLIEAYQTNIATYNKAVFREEIVDKYLEVIRTVNTDLAESLEKDSIKGRLDTTQISDAEAGITEESKKELAAAHEDDEDVMDLMTGETANFEAQAVKEDASSDSDFGSDLQLNFN